MLEKLKNALSLVKQGFLYIIAPLLALLAYITYLRGKNTSLLDRLNKAEAEKHLADAISKKVEATHEANSAELDYNTLRDKYLAQERASGTKDTL